MKNKMETKQQRSHNKLWLAFFFCLLLNVLTICMLGYGAFYTTQKFERMSEVNDRQQRDVDSLKKVRPDIFGGITRWSEAKLTAP